MALIYQNFHLDESCETFYKSDWVSWTSARAENKEEEHNTTIFPRKFQLIFQNSKTFSSCIFHNSAISQPAAQLTSLISSNMHAVAHITTRFFPQIKLTSLTKVSLLLYEWGKLKEFKIILYIIGFVICEWIIQQSVSNRPQEAPRVDPWDNISFFAVSFHTWNFQQVANALPLHLPASFSLRSTHRDGRMTLITGFTYRSKLDWPVWIEQEAFKLVPKCRFFSFFAVTRWLIADELTAGAVVLNFLFFLFSAVVSQSHSVDFLPF